MSGGPWVGVGSGHPFAGLGECLSTEEAADLPPGEVGGRLTHLPCVHACVCHFLPAPASGVWLLVVPEVSSLGVESLAPAG